MITRLLFNDRDLVLDDLPEPDPDLMADLELHRLVAAMAAGDDRVEQVVRRVLPVGVRGVDGAPPTCDLVLARQAVIRDALADPALVRSLYRVAADAVDAERRVWGGALRNAELVLHRAVEVLDGLLDAVAAMRSLLARDRDQLHSTGLLALADRLATDIDDGFVRDARGLLGRLSTRTLVVTAGLGPGNRPAGFTLRSDDGARRRLRDSVGLGRERGLPVEVTLHDQNAMNALAELRAQSVAPVAGAVLESAEHLLAFCRRLRDETAFLVGCVNLAEALRPLSVPLTAPDLVADGGPGLRATAILDPCLALALGKPVVANDLDTDLAPLTVVTGANGGGKSTLARAVGVARIMADAGLPVAAGACRLRPSGGVVVHFPRGESGDGADGRLDAELGRLRDLVGRVRPGALVILNEPLAAVNERDGSAIADELVRGLLDGGAEVWLVTHHHELAARLHADPPCSTVFLRAARGHGSDRPYLVEPAPPLLTSFGEDLWAAEIGTDGATSTIA